MPQSIPGAGALALGALSLWPCLPQDPPPQAPPEEAPSPPAQEPQAVPELLVLGTLGERGVPRVPLDHIGSRDVLGPDEVRRTGARELNDLVLHLPALSARPYNGGEAAAPSFSLRGLPDDGLTEYLLTLIDGVPAHPMPYGWTAFSFFPLVPEQVHAVEILRGGHAVRHSPNTVGGVLNFLTPPIPGGPRLEAQSTVGSNGYASTLATYGDGTDGGFGWLLSMGDRRGDGYREDGGFGQRWVDAKARWGRGAGGWTAARLSYMESEHQAPGGLTVAEHEADPFANARPEGRFEGFRWLGELVHRAGGEREHVEAFAWLSQTRRELTARRPVFGTPTEVRDWTDDTHVAALGVRGAAEARLAGVDHDLYWGLRAQHEWLPAWEVESRPFAGGPSTPLQDAEYRLTALSAHIDDTVRPTERLQVNAGVRLEWVPEVVGKDGVLGGRFEDDFLEPLPAAGFSYGLTDRWFLFGTAQRSFRAPQVWGFDLSASPADQDLSFEEGTSFELGTRALLPAGLSGSATAWRTDFEDVGVFYSGFYENLGRIVAEGVDLGVEWDAGEVAPALEGLSLRASWTLQDSELREGPEAGNETPYAWEEKAAWSVQYATRRDLRFTLSGTHVGSSYSDEANTSVEPPNGNLGINRSRTLWDGWIEKRWRGVGGGLFSFGVGATNLLDEEWYVHSRGGFFGGGRVSGPPRQLSLRFTASF